MDNDMLDSIGHDQIGDAPSHLDDYLHDSLHDARDEMKRGMIGDSSWGGWAGRQVGEWAANNPRTAAGLAAAGTLAATAALAPELSAAGAGIGAARAAVLGAEALGIVDAGTLAGAIAAVVETIIMLRMRGLPPWKIL